MLVEINVLTLVEKKKDKTKKISHVTVTQQSAEFYKQIIEI